MYKGDNVIKGKKERAVYLNKYSKLYFKDNNVII